MGLLDQIKEDVKKITTNTKMFGVELTFTTPDNPPFSCTVGGTTTKHRISVDREGAPYNGRNFSCTVSEGALLDADYPVRNNDGEVSLKNHIVSFKDSTGTTGVYKIESWYPDEKIGLIVCILGFYGTN